MNQTLNDAGKPPGSPRLVAYTTMATWCAACKRAQPQLQELRSAFGNDELELVGVPVDENDQPDQLAEYVRRYQPAYRLLSTLTDAQRTSIERVVQETLQSPALPATVVTNSRGDVLLSVPGVPSVSKLREVLEHKTNP